MVEVSRADDANRHHRHVNACERATYATPFMRNSADVIGSSRCVDTSPRWIAPDTAMRTAAACAVPGTVRRAGLSHSAISAMGRARKPAYRPIAWSAEMSNMTSASGTYLRTS